MNDDAIRKLNDQIEEARRIMRRDKIVPVANHTTFDASMGFDTLKEGIEFIQVFMNVAEDVDPDQREEAAYRDIALYRDGRILAVVRRGPGGIPEVTVFGNTEDMN